MLISGAVITEQIFGIPGFGRLTIDAVNQRDYALIQGVVLVAAAGTWSSTCSSTSSTRCSTRGSASRERRAMSYAELDRGDDQTRARAGAGS